MDFFLSQEILKSDSGNFPSDSLSDFQVISKEHVSPYAGLFSI